MMKKVLSLILALVLIMTMSVTAFAENNVTITGKNSNNILQSEAELILLKEAGNEKALEEKGFSKEEVKKIMETDFHALLLERAALPYETLRNYGYNEEQIAILKNYNGEEITKDSPVLKATAVVSATPNLNTYGRSAIGVRLDWSWNVRPVYGMQDALAIKWKTILKGGSIGEGRATNAYAFVKYYNVSTGSLDHVKNIGADTSVYNETADIKFPMIEVTENESWAKQGSFYLKIEPTAENAQLDHITLYPSYGHKIGSCTISFYIDADTVFPIFSPKTKMTTTMFDEVLAYYNGRLILQ